MVVTMIFPNFSMFLLIELIMLLVHLLRVIRPIVNLLLTCLLFTKDICRLILFLLFILKIPSIAPPAKHHQVNNKKANYNNYA